MLPHNVCAGNKSRTRARLTCLLACLLARSLAGVISSGLASSVLIFLVHVTDSSMLCKQHAPSIVRAKAATSCHKLQPKQKDLDSKFVGFSTKICEMVSSESWCELSKHNISKTECGIRDCWLEGTSPHLKSSNDIVRSKATGRDWHFMLTLQLFKQARCAKALAVSIKSRHTESQHCSRFTY